MPATAQQTNWHGEAEDSFTEALASIRSVLNRATDECLAKIEMAIRRSNREEAIAAVNRMFDGFAGFEHVTLESPLSDLGINVRTVNALEEMNVFTIREVCGLTSQYLDRIRNFGPKAIGELEQALRRHGFKLRAV